MEGKKIELVKPGFANGISMQLWAKQNALTNPPTPTFEGDVVKLSDQEKEQIIGQAAYYYGEFLTALGCDWKNDPNSRDTPRRVAKAYVFCLLYTSDAADE